MASIISAPVESSRISAQNALALVGRIFIAAIFVMSGANKIAQPGATLAYIGAVGLPFPQLALAGSAIVELAGGLALILGYRAQSVAALLAAFSLITAWLFHSDLTDQNQFIHFFKNIAMAGGLLQVVAFGGGRLSLDARPASKA